MPNMIKICEQSLSYSKKHFAYFLWIRYCNGRLVFLVGLATCVKWESVICRDLLSWQMDGSEPRTIT